VESAWRPPRRHATSDPVRSLVNVAILPSFAGCWCGVTPGLCLFGLSPNRRGGVAVTPPAFSEMKSLIRQYSDVARGVGLPMLTEFQLWVLSTVVLVAIAIVSVKLPV